MLPAVLFASMPRISPCVSTRTLPARIVMRPPFTTRLPVDFTSSWRAPKSRTEPGVTVRVVDTTHGSAAAEQTSSAVVAKADDANPTTATTARTRATNDNMRGPPGKAVSSTGRRRLATKIRRGALARRRSATRRAGLGEVSTRIVDQHRVDLRLRHARFAEARDDLSEDVRRMPVGEDRRRNGGRAAAPAPHRVVREHDLPLEADAEEADQRRLPRAIGMEELEAEAVEAE